MAGIYKYTNESVEYDSMYVIALRCSTMTIDTTLTFGSATATTLTVSGAATIGTTLGVTGLLTATGSIALPSAGTITGAGTGTNGITIVNPKNSANTTVSGTAKTVTVTIGATPYYFLVYPTSSA